MNFTMWRHWYSTSTSSSFIDSCIEVFHHHKKGVKVARDELQEWNSKQISQPCLDKSHDAEKSLNHRFGDWETHSCGNNSLPPFFRLAMQNIDWCNTKLVARSWRNWLDEPFPLCKISDYMPIYFVARILEFMPDIAQRMLSWQHRRALSGFLA